MINLSESVAWSWVRQIFAGLTIRKQKKMEERFQWMTTILTQFIQDIVITWRSNYNRENMKLISLHGSQ